MYSSEERKQPFRIFLYFRMVLCSKDWNCSLNLYSWSAPCKIPVPPLTINKSGTCRSYVQIKMPFANFFRKSAGTCSSPPASTPSTASPYTTTLRTHIQTLHLSLLFPLSQDHALQQMDLLVGDEDQISGWEVPEECVWLEVVPSHGSRPSTARSTVGRPKTPRTPMGSVKESRFIEMFDADL